jgi:hypothetical protein
MLDIIATKAFEAPGLQIRLNHSSLKMDIADESFPVIYYDINNFKASVGASTIKESIDNLWKAGENLRKKIGQWETRHKKELSRGHHLNIQLRISDEDADIISRAIEEGKLVIYFSKLITESELCELRQDS